MAWIANWPGGRVWKAKSGKLTFYIIKSVNGRRYVKKTPATTVKVAMGHLARFEADPDAYNASGAPAGERLVLDDKMIDLFDTWQRDVKENCPDYTNCLRRQLVWWKGKLGDRDLRRLDLRSDIVMALKSSKDGKAAIKAIKGLFSWLRKTEFLVKPEQDPTLNTITTPTIKPAQWKKSKVVPLEVHQRVVALTRLPYRNALIVLAGTGWHVTEVRRLAQAGSVEDLPASASKAHGAVAVLVCPKRKSGESQRTAVTAEVAEAARALVAQGGMSPINFYRELKRACLAAGVEPYGAGQYRHSVATWAIEQGSDPAAVAAFLGHRSAATTKRFYSVYAVVPRVPTLA